jgi:hypothetical protein
MEHLKGFFGKKSGKSTKKEDKSSLDDRTEQMGKLNISAAFDKAVGDNILTSPNQNGQSPPSAFLAIFAWTKWRVYSTSDDSRTV